MGTAGSVSGKEMRAGIVKTARQFVKGGEKNPAIFELAGLFEDKVGPDRISDMLARILREEITAYTERVLIAVGALQPRAIGEPLKLPINPFNGEPVMLVPTEILRDLPMAL